MGVQVEETIGRTAAAPSVERIDTVVVGGGQAGLATGYHLARLGVPFVILDAGERVGDSWRQRWDSLRLFTPAGYAGLPGMPFPAPRSSFPTRDEMADYLEAYAQRFGLPVLNGVTVDALGKEAGRFLLASGDRRFEADRVVLATGAFDAPRVPAFAADLDPRIVQLHSSEYRDPGQLVEGDVLVVGAGNSGADIALELARTRRTWLSGRHPGHLPFRLEGRVARVAFALLWQAWTHVLTTRTPVGRRVRGKVVSRSGPLIRVRPEDFERAGVRRVGRTAGVRDGAPVLEDGRTLAVTNVIWCTGFRPQLEWVDLPVCDERGEPVTDRGVTAEPGLYVVGREFLHAFNSHTIGGVGRDAAHIAAHIASRSGVRAARRRRG